MKSQNSILDSHYHLPLPNPDVTFSGTPISSSDPAPITWNDHRRIPPHRVVSHTMLRQGKTQGWLSLPSQAFSPWAHLNGVRFHEVKPGHIEGRGSALIASKAVINTADGAECLLTVPKDLILSLEQILEQAKVDRDFREVLESLGDFGRVGHHMFQLPFFPTTISSNVCE